MSGKHPGFLPIAEGSTAGKDAAGRLHLGGIVFDMDGTLCTYLLYHITTERSTTNHNP